MIDKELLIITTPADHSARFFHTVAGWRVSVVFYTDLHAINGELRFDAIYFRDPFNEGSLTEPLWPKKAVAELVRRQPNARLIDNICAFDDLLIEDKWRQYDLAKEFFPKTDLLRSPDEINETTLAKKRISARSRDIIFDPKQLKGTVDIYIVQPRLSILEEYRVYVVLGQVVHTGMIKTSKQEDNQAKIKAVVELPEDIIEFAAAIHETVPYLDLYGLDVARIREGLKLIEINRSPQFKRYNELTNMNLAQQLLKGFENEA